MATRIPSQFQVSAPARLHLGFLDLNGGIGRKFGSIGLAISDFETTLSGTLSDTLSIAHEDPALCQRVKSIVATFYCTIGKNIPASQQGLRLDIHSLIPSHAGLGSGTQLTLAVGTLLCRLHAIDMNTSDIALQLGRGQRSGIGVATFEHGGFILDGGLKPKTAVPPILCKLAFPNDWRIVLLEQPDHQGVHGTQETAAFHELPPFPITDAQAICHLTLMQLLPALIEADLPAFGKALTHIQCAIGDHFAPAQGGRFSSPQIAAVLTHAVKLGHHAIAQSSWGPTACIFVENAGIAEQLTVALNDVIQHDPQLNNVCITTVQANHQGAVITQTAV